MSDDYPHTLVKSFGNVLKLGVSWMSLSKKYEGTGESCKVRVGKDPEDKMLVRLSSCITSFLGACASLDELQQDPGSAHMVSVLTGLGASQVFPETETSEAYAVFFDSIGFRASILEQHLARCGENAEKLVGGHHQLGESCWRKDLGQDASFSDLKTAAKTSLKKLDGTQLKTAVEQLQEARRVTAMVTVTVTVTGIRFSTNSLNLLSELAERGDMNKQNKNIYICYIYKDMAYLQCLEILFILKCMSCMLCMSVC